MKNNSKDIRTFVIFFLGWWLYFTQGIVGLRGNIAPIILVVMLAWSFYYYYKVMASANVNPLLKTMNYIFLLYIVYGLVLIIAPPATGRIAPFDYVKKISFSIIPIYGFYYIMRRISIKENGIILIIIGLLLSGIGEYLDGVRALQEKIMTEGIAARSADEMINSSTYRFVPIIPLLFLIKKQEWFKYATLIVILIYSVMGVKRGPILMGAVGAVILIWDSFGKNAIHRIKLTHVVISVAAIIVGYYLLSKMIMSNDFFLSRLEMTLEGNSSGRDTIYSRYYSHFMSESNILVLLLGNGADSTLRLFGLYAHNDWLEIALNQGILGLIIYGCYYYQMVKYWIKAKPCHELFMCFGVLIITTFITSLLSMSINNQRISAHVCLAYCIAMVDNYIAQKRTVKNLE